MRSVEQRLTRGEGEVEGGVHASIIQPSRPVGAKRKRLNFPDILRIKHRDRPIFSERSFRIFVELHPDETAMGGIRVNADDHARAPIPEILQEDFHPVIDFDLVSHFVLRKNTFPRRQPS